MKNILFTLFLFPSVLSAQSDLTLIQILDKHAEAMGGIENWRNFQSHIIVHNSTQGERKYTSTLTMKMPNKFRIDLKTNDGFHRIKSYDGKEGWILKNDELLPMPVGEDIEMAEEAEFYGELVMASERGYDLKFLGTENLDGKEVFKIKMTKSETDEQFYYVNSKTFLLEMVAEHSEDVNWAGTFFKTTFSDYRKVDNMMFPFGMELFANDKLLRTFQTTDIQANVKIEDSVFDKDLNIIKRNIRLFSEALVNQDFDFVVDAYTTDGKIFPNNRPILEGPEALRKYWTPPPGSKNRITYHKITPTEITVTGDSAYDFGYYEGRSIGNDGNESSWKGKYVIVWKEVEPDVWKMYLDIWNRVP